MAVATSSSSSSNPISSLAPPSSSPISSFPDPSASLPSYSDPNPTSLLTHLNLSLRSKHFRVDRETLMTLPESVLLCLFPNGLALSRGMGGGGGSVGGGWGTEHEGEEGHDEGNLFEVDYDPATFDYILSFWHRAHSNFYGPTPTYSTSNPSSDSLYAYQQALLPPHVIYPGGGSGGGMEAGGSGPENPLTTKQPIIVLREELEYFSIPLEPGTEHVPSFARSAPAPALPSSSTAPAGTAPTYPFAQAKTLPNGDPTALLSHVKREAGRALLDRRKVFTALQRNVSKEGNLAEQHLIDMLCMSGFSREDSWGYRSLEPSRCCISSIALVLLKTGIDHHAPAPDSPEEQRTISVDQQQMNTAQKLLLFWRKPARKCWWDGVSIELPITEVSDTLAPVKIWARRVWTLELSLI